MPHPAALRQQLGPIGVWSFRFDALAPGEASDAAMEIERLGFPCLWVPEVGHTEAMSLVAHLLHSTYSLTIANGIARMGDRSPGAAAAGHRYLQRLSGGRHVMGLGLGGTLSNEPRPLDIVSDYLDSFESAWNGHPADEGSAPSWCLAAYGAGMARLAAERTDGVHTYLADPSHTASVRAVVGDTPLIAVEVPVVLTDDPDEALATGRSHLSRYLQSPSNLRKFRRLGFGDEDFEAGGSDRLVSHLIVHGSEAIRDRITAHRAAGADHVSVQILGTSSLREDLDGWATVARLVL